MDLIGQLKIIICFGMLIVGIIINCFEGEDFNRNDFLPKLVEPQFNHIIPSNEKNISFRWELSPESKNYFIYHSISINMDGKQIAMVLPEKTSYEYTTYNPLTDGTHTWAIIAHTKEGLSFSSKSQFLVNNPPCIQSHSLNNLQAYIDDYLIVAVEFNEPMYGVELNKSVTIDSDAALSELETEDQTLFYFKIRNFEWDRPYILSFSSSIKNGAKNSLRQTSLRFRTPLNLPQPKAIGWIGGGKDGWQKVNGPEKRDTYDGGLGDREFSDAQTISLSPDEKMLYISDPPNYRVQRWTTDGIYQGWIGGSKEGWRYGICEDLSLMDSNNAVKSYFIGGIVSSYCDSLGYLYLANHYYDVIEKWDQSGNFIEWFGQGETGWQTRPLDIIENPFLNYFTNITSSSFVKDNKGMFYITTPSGLFSFVSKFTENGDPMGWIGCGIDGWRTDSFTASVLEECHFLDVDDNYDSIWMNQMPDLTGLAVDRNQNLFVGERFKNCVTKWSKEGKPIGWIGHGKDGWQTGSIAFSEFGEHDLRSFSYPAYIAIDDVGNLFIADFHNHRVSKWTKDGKAVGWIGHGKDGWQTGDAPEYEPDSYGKGNMEYNRIPGAEGIAVDSRGTIYVSGTEGAGYNWRVSKWVMDDGEGGGGTPVEE